MSLLLSGIGVSKGVAFGKAYVMTQGQMEVPEYEVPEYLIDDEVARFNDAVEQVREQLYAIKETVADTVPDDLTEFIEPHILTLNENAVYRKPRSIIRKKKINAEWALKLQCDKLVRMMRESGEPLLQTRRDDLEHVIEKILLVLKQQELAPVEEEDDPETGGARIMVVDRISAGDLAMMASEHLAGIISAYDAPNSHTAIMARSLRIPAITGVPHAHNLIRDGERIILDGKYGMAVVNPDARSIQHYQRLAADIFRYKQELTTLRNRPAVTRDNRTITLGANIDSSSDISELEKSSAEAVGLYRTEYLFVNRETPPTEEEQFGYYQGIATQLGGMEINIRTLDIGADKSIPGVDANPRHSNPMLGMRAIRLSLKNPQLFEPQIRAILRASAYGKVNIILPLITSFAELTKATDLIARYQSALLEEGHTLGEVKLGIMIETPASAMMIDFFARHVDFVAIGTNDLTQYTLAIDRSDEQVSHLYDNSHPAVLRMIYSVIQTCKALEKPALVYGEMAGNPMYTRLLVGMGLTNFSVTPSQILEIKKRIRETNYADAKARVEEIIDADHPDHINLLIETLNQ
jgi:phosphoenolpyruvate-protein phosphotransferase (PTS system enzyme I)